MRIIFIVLLLLLFSLNTKLSLANEASDSPCLTVYNQNFALVREIREVTLDKGRQIIRLENIPSNINPTSIQLKSLTDPDSISILEQYYEYEPLNFSLLLSKYLNKEIRIITKNNNLYQGYLSSYSGNQIILVKDKETGPVYVIDVSDISAVEFSKLPEGLTTKPTLVFYIESKVSGAHKIELNYLTQCINWSTDYVASISKEQDYLSLNGWITISNKSGTSYNSASLKLIAGEIEQEEKMFREVEMLKTTTVPSMPQFEEREFFEYHIYNLERKVTLENNQTKQISLLNVQEIPVKKLFIYDGALYRSYYYDNWRNQGYNDKVSVYLELENKDEYGLGIPLPKGKIRVYMADQDGTLEFIGEDSIDHTPKDERIRLSLGNAFDLVGERKIVEHKKISNTVYQDTYEITLKNHKEEPVEVKVIERQWGEWEVLKSNFEYTKTNAYMIEFNVEVPANDEVKIIYTSQYKF